MPSQMNLRLLAKAKSRTVIALKTQVFFALVPSFSFSRASSAVTIITGESAERAFPNRDCCSLVNTLEAFCNSPVAPTM